jgi:hypothetical protein
MNQLILVIISLVLLVLSGCTPFYVDGVKASAHQRWKELGFEVTRYEGYQRGLQVAPGYGGAHVRYTA